MEIKVKSRHPNGVTTLDIEEDGKTHTKNFKGFRAGLSWPMPANPGGFFCIAGQEVTRLITGECPIVIVKEFEGPSLTILINTLFDQMGIFGCREIYTNVSQKYMTFIQALDSIRRSKRPDQPIMLKQAPYSESFIHGNELIKKWIREIRGLTFLKDSAIRSELKGMRQDEQHDDLRGGPEEKFFATNALRYVLAAFDTSEVRNVSKEQEKGLPRGAWT